MALLAFANSVNDLVSGRMIHIFLGDFNFVPLNEDVCSRKLQNVPETEATVISEQTYQYSFFLYLHEKRDQFSNIQVAFSSILEVF